MLNELKQLALKQYNATQATPVNEYDQFFKAYLIGMMSVMISDTAYKQQIKRLKQKLNVGGK